MLTGSTSPSLPSPQPVDCEQSLFFFRFTDAFSHARGHFRVAWVLLDGLRKNRDCSEYTQPDSVQLFSLRFLYYFGAWYRLLSDLCRNSCNFFNLQLRLEDPGCWLCSRNV